LKSTILAFSGGIKSGKTTISSNISSILKWKRVSFGEYIQRIAEKDGIIPSRDNLQELGEKEIDSGWKNFCFNVLEMVRWKNGENLIIDGIRHKEALDQIKKITSPSDVYLVFIELDLKNRESRIVNTENFENIKRYELHSTEKQVNKVLPEISDLIIDGNKSIGEITDEILRWLNEKNGKIYF